MYPKGKCTHTTIIPTVGCVWFGLGCQDKCLRNIITIVLVKQGTVENFGISLSSPKYFVGCFEDY